MSVVVRRILGESIEKRISVKFRRLIAIIPEYVANRTASSFKRFVILRLIAIQIQLLTERDYDQAEGSLVYSFADHG